MTASNRLVRAPPGAPGTSSDAMVTDRPAAMSSCRIPSAPIASTLRTAGSCRLRCSTVADVEVTISSVVVRMPMAARRSTYPSRATIELFVAKRTRTPRRCISATSSDAPGTGSAPR